MSARRFVTLGSDVIDRETRLMARFSDEGSAQEGADWFNSGNATLTDYRWEKLS